MALNPEDVEKLIRWNNNGKWRVVYVRSKEDHMKVRNGVPTSGFWDLWRTNKDEIKAIGISVKKEEDEETGASNWVVAEWADSTDEEKEEAQDEWQKKMAAREQKEENLDTDYE